jgi:hypothetical protein
MALYKQITYSTVLTLKVIIETGGSELSNREINKLSSTSKGKAAPVLN